MFIDSTNPTTRAPAERNVREIGHVSLLRSEKNVLKLAFYKYFVPTGRGTGLDRNDVRENVANRQLPRITDH